LPKSTTHRLLSTLERRGLVARDPVAGMYRLATKMFTPVGAGPEVRVILEELASRSGETANLGALIGSEVLYIDRADSPHALRWQLGVGSRVPVHCSGLGKAILAFLPASEVERRLPPVLKPFTGNTLTDRRALLRELAKVRRRGFALDCEEFMDGVQCVAVPVRNPAHEVAVAISLAGPVFRLTRKRAEGLVPALHDAAARMGAELETERPAPSSGA
jgi:IclR family transcriptional regulator, acetate operon repressor